MLPSRATGGRQAPWLHRLRLHSMATKTRAGRHTAGGMLLWFFTAFKGLSHRYRHLSGRFA
jgi:hypothetical protein